MRHFNSLLFRRIILQEKQQQQQNAETERKTGNFDNAAKICLKKIKTKKSEKGIIKEV